MIKGTTYLLTYLLAYLTLKNSLTRYKSSGDTLLRTHSRNFFSDNLPATVMMKYEKLGGMLDGCRTSRMTTKYVYTVEHHYS